MTVKIRNIFYSAIILLVSTCLPSLINAAELTGVDKAVFSLAEKCRDDVASQMQGLVKSGELTMNQLFDTFYIPIPNIDPQKYTTQYDKLLDVTILDTLDACLEADDRLVFVVAVDRNGYLPTHNSKYSRPLTGNAGIDVGRNRTKRIFNDRTGLAAARNKKSVLLQKYSRDTGEEMADLSVPIFFGKKHWGALRIGYKVKK